MVTFGLIIFCIGLLGFIVGTTCDVIHMKKHKTYISSKFWTFALCSAIVTFIGSFIIKLFI